MPLRDTTPHSTQPRPPHRALLITLLCCACALLCSCVSYSDQLRDTRYATAIGDMDLALSVLNAKLGLNDDLDVPASLAGERTLLLMERAVILQAQGSYKLSARDMVNADSYLEFLDIEASSVEDLGKFLYNDSASKYRAPAYERLILNILNMINFLAIYELEGARVEARRFAIMERYFLDDAGKPLLPHLLAVGNYLSAATYEASKDYRAAARYYSRAWMLGIRDQPTRARLLDLYRLTGYQPRDLDDPFFTQLTQEAREAGSISIASYAQTHQRGDTLIIAQYGFVPYKSAQRLPTQRLVTMAQHSRTYHRHDHVSSQLSNASYPYNSTISFPVLTDAGLPSRSTASASVSINGQPMALTLGVDLSQSVQQAWSEIAGPLMLAALTRATTRQTIGEVGRAASQGAAQNPSTAGIGLLGWLVSTTAEATLDATDTPDTRSWTTLPAHVRITRTKLPQGLHTIDMRVDGSLERQLAPVWEDRLNLLNFSRNR